MDFILLSLYYSRKSDPTKKSDYFNKSGISVIKLLREVFTNYTIVKVVFNEVVSFKNMRSLAPC